MAASAGLYIVQREWNLPLQISLALIVVGLAVFALLDPERVRVALTGRQARYGSNTLVLTIAFLGILVVINYLVFNNTKRWDLTEDKQFTLAAETIATLQELPQAVKAQAFFTQRYPTEQAKGLLDQYQYHSKGKLTYEFVDPEANPVAAEQAGIERDGTIVFTMGTQVERVTSISEQGMTEALVRLINPETRVVYFLVGHGEYDPESFGEQSYSSVKRGLQSKNYAVKTLNLLAENKIPEDAKVIVTAGPKKPLASGEVELLRNFLDGGGAVIVMEEPLPLTSFGEAADPLAEYLEGSWGIKLGKDIIVDLTSQQPFAPYAAEYGSHAITQKMNRITSQFPTVRSVQVASQVEGVSQVELVKTAQQSWAETDIAALASGNQNQQVTFAEGQDIPGPISLAVAAENFNSRGRVVVFGDADFVADANYVAYGNSDLFLNSVDWAAGQENLISLTPRTNTQRMMLPPQKVTLNLIFLGSVILLPGATLVAGIVVWIQRRRRG